MELEIWFGTAVLKAGPKWPISEESRELWRFRWLKENEKALIFLLTCAGRETYGYFKP
jgi:hypothetical protein